MNEDTRELSARHWTRVRNPFRVIVNGIICEVCKYIPSVRLKNMLYRLIGVDVGEGVVIAPHVQLDPIAPELISIGDGAVIGWGADVFTHEFVDGTFRTAPVDIGEDCTIGALSLIRGGVSVGDGTIVGMKTFLNKDVDADEVVGGVPAHHLRDRDAGE